MVKRPMMMILKDFTTIKVKYSLNKIVVKIEYTYFFWLDGRVVMQRPAKPFTPVRFRLQPPLIKSIILKLVSINVPEWWNW